LSDADVALTVMTTEEKVARFVALEKRKRDLDRELREVKGELATLEVDLLDWFERNGVKNMGVQGMLVYVHQQLWAAPADGDYERACLALRAAGLDDFVREQFNIHQVSAWVRERAKAGEELPPSFTGNIDVREQFTLRARRA